MIFFFNGSYDSISVASSSHGLLRSTFLNIFNRFFFFLNQFYLVLVASNIMDTFNIQSSEF